MSSIKKLPKPPIEHLIWLTSSKGILQHSDRDRLSTDHGYATDDNARALMVSNFLHAYWSIPVDEQIRLQNIYLTALENSQHSNGLFYCYLGFDGGLHKLEMGDWTARSLFALAFSYGYMSDEQKKRIIAMLERSVPTLQNYSYGIHTKGFLIATANLIHKDKKLNYLFSDFERMFARWKHEMIEEAEKHTEKDWLWPEEKISYDNGKVIQAYLIFGDILNDKKLTHYGKEFLTFYIRQTFRKGYFQAPGCKGFWTKSSRPEADEQCLEIYSVISALITGSEMFNDNSYLKRAKKAYAWFYGENRLQKSLINEEEKRIYDGLGLDYININRGAESCLSAYLSYIALKQKILI